MSFKSVKHGLKEVGDRERVSWGREKVGNSHFEYGSEKQGGGSKETRGKEVKDNDGG